MIRRHTAQPLCKYLYLADTAALSFNGRRVSYYKVIKYLHV